MLGVMSTPRDESTTPPGAPASAFGPPSGAGGGGLPASSAAAAPANRRSLRASGVVVALVGAALLAAVIADFQTGAPYGYGRTSSTTVWFTLLVIPWVLTVVGGALFVRPRRLAQAVAGAVVGFGVLVLVVEIAGIIAGDRFGGGGFVGGDRLAFRIARLSPYSLHIGIQLTGTEVVRYACASAVLGAVFGFVVIVVVTGLDRSWFPALGGAFAGALLLGIQPLITHAAKHPYTLSYGAAGAIVLLGIGAVAAALDAPAVRRNVGEVATAPAAGQTVAPAGHPRLMPTNAFAVVSLVLGLLGGNLLAVIFGHLGRRQIRETGERGDGLALAGLILGYLGIFFWAILFIVALANSA